MFTIQIQAKRVLLKYIKEKTNIQQPVETKLTVNIAIDLDLLSKTVTVTT